MKFSTMTLLSALVALSGCSSDVDKCVDAQVSAWKTGSMWPGAKTEAEARAVAHLACLESQGRKWPH